MRVLVLEHVVLLLDLVWILPVLRGGLGLLIVALRFLLPAHDLLHLQPLVHDLVVQVIDVIVFLLVLVVFIIVHLPIHVEPLIILHVDILKLLPTLVIVLIGSFHSRLLLLKMNSFCNCAWALKRWTADSLICALGFIALVRFVFC